MFEMLKNYFFKNGALIFLLVFVFIVFREWVIPAGYLTSGDWPFFYIEELKNFSGFPQLWESFSGIGFVDLIPAFAGFKFLYSVLSRFVDYSISERILYFWPAFIFAPLFSFFFFSKIFKHIPAILISVFVYIFNTYYLLLSTGHITLMVSYAFLPIIFYFFKLTLEKNHLTNGFITSLLLFASSVYEPRITYIICLILLFYFIYRNISELFSLVKFIKIGSFAFFPILITLLLSLFWILPVASVGSLTTNSLFVRYLFGNEFINILYASTLFHPFWTGANPSIFVVQMIPLQFWIIPITAFIGLFLNRKDKLVLFFGFLSLVGILLTKQTAPPFTDFYLWLYQHFPGFNAFREASKFYIIIAFGYAVLIGSLVEFIWNTWRKDKTKVYVKYLITISLGLLFLFNTRPFILDEMKTLFVQRSVPQDYILIKDFITNQKEFFRTLWIPTLSRWSINVNEHPAISAVDRINSEWDNIIKDKRNDKITEAELMKELLFANDSKRLLEISSIKYVVVPLEDKLNDDNFFVHYGKNRQYYIDQLANVDYLRRIDIGTKSIIVYENKKFREHIYITKEKETIKKEINYENINYNYITSTEYNFKLTTKVPVYVNFSESYYPDWKLRVGDFNWFKVLLEKNYFISDRYHDKNDAMLNSFYLDPEEVCEEFSCRKNADGSFDISGTLYFKPQSYMYLGVFISIGTGAIITGWLLLILVKKNYEKKRTK